MNYKSTSHWFHLFMTLFTGGFWIIIWLACWASNEQHNKQVDRQQQAEQNQNAKFVNGYKGWMNK